MEYNKTESKIQQHMENDHSTENNITPEPPTTIPKNISEPKDTIEFWSDNPNALFDSKYILEFFPVESMSLNQKLNAITRMVIILFVVSFIVTNRTSILISLVITLAAIFIYYYYGEQSRQRKETKRLNLENMENYDSPATAYLNSQGKTISPEVFDGPSSSNPFSNVLITDIGDDPTRKSAPPAFNVDVDEDITKNIKKSVQFMNPEIKNTNKQLFSSLTDNFYLDQSNRAFFSTANTKIPNDQKAYGEFLYGNMPSAKESSVEGNLQRVKDNYRYLLY
jgi:hypothetical protein